MEEQWLAARCASWLLGGQSLGVALYEIIAGLSGWLLGMTGEVLN
jgi:hypothetical protein